MANKKYHKHIVSTDSHQVWLHRTFRDNLDSILEHGLAAVDITATASVQPYDLETAKGIYNSGKDYGDVAVVIKFPRDIVNELSQKKIKPPQYTMHKSLGYYNPEKKAFMIQRKYIAGYIDRKTNEYQENPYLSNEQELGPQHFPEEIFGDLEKKVILKKSPFSDNSERTSVFGDKIKTKKPREKIKIVD